MPASKSKNEKTRHPLRRTASSLRSLRERHHERNRPTGFGFVFADRIDYLDAGRWDSMARSSSFFLRRDVLRAIENDGPENIVPRYAMIFREEKPVAIVVAQLVTITGERLSHEKSAALENKPRNLLKRMLAPVARKAGAGIRQRILVAGNLLSWGCHGVAFAPDENPAELWPAVAEALYRIRRAERLMGQTDLIMVKDLTLFETGHDALHRFSFRPLKTDPNMVLEIPASWLKYEDYLGALDSKNRYKAKDQMKKLAAGGCTVEPLSDLSPYSARLHELYLAVHGKASVRPVTLPDSYLPKLAGVAGDDFRCTVIRRGEEILGFITSIRDGDTAIAYYIGFDRAAAEAGLPLYLRLLHTTVADAIGWRCKRLSLGRTALEPKASLGAKPEPMSIWLRHRVPPLNWMLRSLLGAIPHSEAPERNPFKSSEQ
jgi:hypothetical protein